MKRHISTGGSRLTVLNVPPRISRSDGDLVPPPDLLSSDSLDHPNGRKACDRKACDQSETTSREILKWKCQQLSKMLFNIIEHSRCVSLNETSANFPATNRRKYTHSQQTQTEFNHTAEKVYSVNCHNYSDSPPNLALGDVRLGRNTQNRRYNNVNICKRNRSTASTVSTPGTTNAVSEHHPSLARKSCRINDTISSRRIEELVENGKSKDYTFETQIGMENEERKVLEEPPVENDPTNFYGSDFIAPNNNSTNNNTYNSDNSTSHNNDTHSIDPRKSTVNNQQYQQHSPAIRSESMMETVQRQRYKRKTETRKNYNRKDGQIMETDEDADRPLKGTIKLASGEVGAINFTQYREVEYVDKFPKETNGMAEHGAVEYGMEEHGAVEHGMTEHGTVEHGMANVKNYKGVIIRNGGRMKEWKELKEEMIEDEENSKTNLEGQENRKILENISNNGDRHRNGSAICDNRRNGVRQIENIWKTGNSDRRRDDRRIERKRDDNSCKKMYANTDDGRNDDRCKNDRRNNDSCTKEKGNEDSYRRICKIYRVVNNDDKRNDDARNAPRKVDNRSDNNTRRNANDRSKNKSEAFDDKRNENRPKEVEKSDSRNDDEGRKNDCRNNGGRNNYDRSKKSQINDGKGKSGGNGNNCRKIDGGINDGKNNVDIKNGDRKKESRINGDIRNERAEMKSDGRRPSNCAKFLLRDQNLLPNVDHNKPVQTSQNLIEPVKSLTRPGRDWTESGANQTTSSRNLEEPIRNLKNPPILSRETGNRFEDIIRGMFVKQRDERKSEDEELLEDKLLGKELPDVDEELMGEELLSEGMLGEELLCEDLLDDKFPGEELLGDELLDKELTNESLGSGVSLSCGGQTTISHSESSAFVWYPSKLAAQRRQSLNLESKLAAQRRQSLHLESKLQPNRQSKLQSKGSWSSNPCSSTRNCRQSNLVQSANSSCTASAESYQALSRAQAPQETNRRPREMIKTPQEANRRPREMIKTPQETNRRPREMIKTPQETNRRPREMIKTPQETNRRPRELIKAPQETNRSPTEIIRDAEVIDQALMKMTKTPQEIRGTAKEIIEGPQGRNWTSMELPKAPQEMHPVMKMTKSPVMINRTPCETDGQNNSSNRGAIAHENHSWLKVANDEEEEVNPSAEVTGTPNSRKLSSDVPQKSGEFSFPIERKKYQMEHEELQMRNRGDCVEDGRSHVENRGCPNLNREVYYSQHDNQVSVDPRETCFSHNVMPFHKRHAPQPDNVDRMKTDVQKYIYSGGEFSARPSLPARVCSSRSINNFYIQSCSLTSHTDEKTDEEQHDHPKSSSDEDSFSIPVRKFTSEQTTRSSRLSRTQLTSRSTQRSRTQLTSRSNRPIGMQLSLSNRWSGSNGNVEAPRLSRLSLPTKGAVETKCLSKSHDELMAPDLRAIFLRIKDNLHCSQEMLPSENEWPAEHSSPSDSEHFQPAKNVNCTSSPNSSSEVRNSSAQSLPSAAETYTKSPDPLQTLEEKFTLELKQALWRRRRQIKSTENLCRVDY